MFLEFGPINRILLGLVIIIFSKIFKKKSKKLANIFFFIGLLILLINLGDSCLLENQSFQNWDECGGDSLVFLLGILIYNVDKLIGLFKKK